MSTVSAVLNLMFENLDELLLMMLMDASEPCPIRSQLESLKSKLETMESFLNDAAEKQETDKRVREFIMEMENCLYKAEDVLEVFSLDYKSRAKAGYIKRCVGKFCKFGECLGRGKPNEVADLMDQVRSFNKNLELYGMKKSAITEGIVLTAPNEYHYQAKQSGCCQIENALVGMKDEEEKLISFLLDKEGEQKRPIITIYGMAGIGKTTLAKKVYNDHEVQSKFEGCAWTKVSKRFRTRQVLEDIFVQLVPECEEEIMAFSTIELVQQLFECLLSKKWLVVLDNVWDADVWKCLCLAFPSMNTASKLVITTRCREVADRIRGEGITVSMRTLTIDESWELFVQKAFSGGGPGKFSSSTSPCKSNQFNGEKEEIGKDLIKKCGGLPLATVLIGNLLGRKHNLSEWKVVNQRINSRISNEPGLQEISQIARVIALNQYYDLPYYLKPCFLYLGLFPEDSKIDVEKLYLLWIAEGLVPSSGKRHVRMDIAESYMNELVSRNMVQVQEQEGPTIRRFRTFHLHDTIRELCLLKGKEENFFEVRDFACSNQLLTKAYSPAIRRLAVYFDKNEDRDLVPSKHDTLCALRSLVLVSENQQRDMILHQEVCSFKHLRSLKILDIGGLKFEAGKFLKRIGELTSLRYLSLNKCSLSELPSSIGNLSNLQILDLRVETSIRLNVPNMLWKMERLRHLYLPHLYQVHGDDKLRLHSLKNLETLQNFDTNVCNANDLINLTNLRQLDVTTEGNVDDLSAIANQLSTMAKFLRQSSLNIRSFNCYPEKKHSLLEKLFECPALNILHIEGHIGKFSQMISSSLTELFLTGSQLHEDPMATLEKFPRLGILVLNGDAFVGKEMHCSASGFPELRQLRLSNLQNLQNMKIEKGAMPNLSTLAIEKCNKLKVLPEGFDFLQSLQKVRIAKCHLEQGLQSQGKYREVWRFPETKSFTFRPI